MTTTPSARRRWDDPCLGLLVQIDDCSTMGSMSVIASACAPGPSSSVVNAICASARSKPELDRLEVAQLAHVVGHAALVEGQPASVVVERHAGGREPWAVRDRAGRRFLAADDELAEAIECVTGVHRGRAERLADLARRRLGRPTPQAAAPATLRGARPAP